MRRNRDEEDEEISEGLTSMDTRNSKMLEERTIQGSIMSLNPNFMIVNYKGIGNLGV